MPHKACVLFGSHEYVALIVVDKPRMLIDGLTIGDLFKANDVTWIKNSVEAWASDIFKMAVEE